MSSSARSSRLRRPRRNPLLRLFSRQPKQHPQPQAHVPTMQSLNTSQEIDFQNLSHNDALSKRRRRRQQIIDSHPHLSHHTIDAVPSHNEPPPPLGQSNDHAPFPHVHSHPQIGAASSADATTALSHSNHDHVNVNVNVNRDSQVGVDIEVDIETPSPHKLTDLSGGGPLALQTLVRKLEAVARERGELIATASSASAASASVASASAFASVSASVSSSLTMRQQQKQHQHGQHGSQKDDRRMAGIMAMFSSGSQRKIRMMNTKTPPISRMSIDHQPGSPGAVLKKRFSRSNLIHYQQQQQQQQMQQQQQQQVIVEQENQSLRKRVEQLEVTVVENDTLRQQVKQLEWALDVVRDDAERVRIDAWNVLAEREKECEQQSERELSHMYNINRHEDDVDDDEFDEFAAGQEQRDLDTARSRTKSGGNGQAKMPSPTSVRDAASAGVAATACVNVKRYAFDRRT